MGELSTVTLPSAVGMSHTVKSLHISLLLLATFPFLARERGTSLIPAHAIMLGSNTAATLHNWALVSWGQCAMAPLHEPGDHLVKHGQKADLSPPQQCPPQSCSQALAGMLIAFELSLCMKNSDELLEALCLSALLGSATKAAGCCCYHIPPEVRPLPQPQSGSCTKGWSEAAS